jgi:Phosphotransferase enzyme family
MSPLHREENADATRRALEALVGDFVNAPDGVDVLEERVKSGVYRLRCTLNGTTRSFVAKRLDPDIALRNELVARRWLPAVGLADSGPPLLDVAAERDGSSVWHLYDDLGDSELDAVEADIGRVATAIAAIAQIHTRFAGHALLPECRLWGGDLGISFYSSSFRDAITSLESARARKGRLGLERPSLCERLLARLEDHLGEVAPRAEALTRYGGRETLLHGDLWRTNVMVAANGASRVRLIDWDHAAVGPFSYDLSTFLSRFPFRDRAAILRLYEEEVGRAGWALPPAAELNRLFETAELARIANRVIWPALAAWEHDADWALDALEEVERWFEQLRPMLPVEET